jgi:hypothetical protein
VLAHLQDEDEAERGAETAKGRELVGVELCHAAMMPAVVAGSSWVRARSILAGGGPEKRLLIFVCSLRRIICLCVFFLVVAKGGCPGGEHELFGRPLGGRVMDM